jgi:hypothetical protein
MPTPVLPGLLKAVVHYSFAGGIEEATNNFHFMDPTLSAWSDTEVDLLHLRIMDWVIALKPLRYSGSVVDRTTYYDYSAATPVVFERTSGHAGTDAGQPLPLEVTIVASIRTGAPGRSNRGRIYFPHLATGDLDVIGGLPGITVAAATLLANSTADLLDGDPAANGGVYSAFLNQWRSATNVVVNYDWDTQRRRGELSLGQFSATIE